MAEQLTVNFNIYSAPRGCVASVVQYGNVLHAPWQRAHSMGQTVRLIETALDTMEGGEVFVPQRLTSVRGHTPGRA
jgi:hypothetical protein